MLIWLLVIVVPLPGLYDYCPRFRYWLKFSLYYLWLMGASLLIIPLSLTRPGSVENARLGARMMNPLTRILGIQWRIKGQTELLRLKRPFLLANRLFRMITDLLVAVRTLVSVLTST